MDRVDRKILALLQQDATLSLAELSQRVGLSQTPCWKRIQKLEKTGVIAARVALLDQKMIGLDVTVFVSIETADHSEGWIARFAEAVAAMPEVMDCWRMAGDVDYLLRVVTPDLSAYDAFYKRLVGAFPMRNVSSRVAIERVKGTTAFPLPIEDAPRNAAAHASKSAAAQAPKSVATQAPKSQAPKSAAAYAPKSSSA